MPGFDAIAIRDALPIDSVLKARGVVLRRGRGPCLVCGTSERSTAFSVRGKFWRCFACGDHGDVVDLLARLERIPPREAFARGAALVGLRRLSRGEQPTLRAKPAWKIAQDARDAAWGRYALAVREREWAASHFTYFHHRCGADHPFTAFAAEVLADAYDAELLAEHAYEITVEDFP